MEKTFPVGELPVEMEGPHGLRALTRVASVDVGQQASGIASWKLEPASR